ncbi:MAG TPA: DUF4388 domain-containing protein [Polyangiaceae bacterium]|nr:DUF4388 domain-containing protein [Polyangiaceae bacterium]
MSVYPPDLDPSEQQGETPTTIFVSDPSAEADRLSAALHGEGYSVIDVPLSLLVARVAVQTPSLILLDIDAEGAFDIVARLRELPGAQGVDILFLGDAGRTLSDSSDALRQEGSGFLARPIDVQALLRTIATLVRAKRDGDDGASSGSSFRPGPDRSVPPPARATRSPLPPQVWSDPAGGLAGGDDGLEPSYGGALPGSPRLPLPALSSEIERLLKRAEERSEQDLGPGSMIPALEAPTPEQEVDAVLPSEVLAALDEPLDEMDDDLESDSGLGTSVPHRVVGTPEVVTSSGHPPGPSEGDEQGEPAAHEAERPAPLAPSHRLPSQPPRRNAPADPKEIETPRPPRRPTSGPPPGVPQAPISPRVGRSSTLPPSARGATSAGPPTIPPVSPRRVRALLAGISAASTEPPPEPFTSSRSLGPTPLPPRRSDGSIPARRTDASPPGETPTESPAGLAPAELPGELGLGDALSAFAICVRERATGALVIDAVEGVRRILLRDGDVVTAASGLDEESLVGFLGTRGDITPDVAAHLLGKIPAYGRHAGAALVANGHIGQDQLWPVLRAHAEWILSCAVLAEKGAASFEVNPPGRLRAEPSVFGGATGAEVLIEVVRRAIPAAAALPRLGGGGARLAEGPRWELLSECALSEAEQHWLGRAKGASIDEALGAATGDDVVPLVYALLQLGVLALETPGMKSKKRRPAARERFDPIDAQAMRSQVKARLNLVEEGDYFSLLGVPRSATAYEIHRAYLELRRGFEPSLVLNAATADLADDLQLIVEVLDEAHDVLRDQSRRERYRRAIEDKPPL